MPTEVYTVKAMVFPVVMYGCASWTYKESSAPKNWCFQTVVLEKTLESSLDCKEIQPVHPKGDQSWVFIRRTDAEAETPILWPPDVKNWLIWKGHDAGKDWGQEEKGTDAGSWHIAYWVHIAYCILSTVLSTASSFRIWNSSTGIISLPGASMRNSAHDKGHEEGGSAYAKARSSFRSPPGNSQASTPKTRVCLLSALCFHLHLWLYRGLSPTTSLWKKS